MWEEGLAVALEELANPNDGLGSMRLLFTLLLLGSVRFADHGSPYSVSLHPLFLVRGSWGHSGRELRQCRQMESPSRGEHRTYNPFVYIRISVG